MVTDPDLGHTASHLLDDTRPFVPEHNRLRYRERLVTHRDISVAHAGGNDSNEDLVVARLSELKDFQRLRRVRRARDGCYYLHGSSPVDITY
jgi:hypothetical protein